MEDDLIHYIMLRNLDIRHYEMFGIDGHESLSDDEQIKLYGNLTPEQKNVLKRDFLMKDLLRASGISKKSALLISLAKHHFPVETAEIESFHNEEYQKKREEIQKQLDKLIDLAPEEESCNEEDEYSNEEMPVEEYEEEAA